MPTISVILPFYNHLEWTNQAVKSVLTQSYQDYEIILIDDGSREDYRRKYGIEDERIKFYTQENKGRSAARNVGLRMAKGKYITFLDSDDLYLPNKLEKQHKVLEDTPETGMAYTNFMVMNEEGIILNKYGNPQIELTGNIYPDLLFIDGAIITTPSVMIRNEIFSIVGEFDEKMHICEDLDLWRRIARITNVIQIREPYVYVRYRKAPDSLWAAVKGRSKYYEKAMQDDSTLITSIRKKLYVDMYFHYCSWSLRRRDPIFFIYSYFKLFRMDSQETARLNSYLFEKVWEKIPHGHAKSSG